LHLKKNDKERKGEGRGNKVSTFWVSSGSYIVLSIIIKFSLIINFKTFIFNLLFSLN
jgi:hypothetical protein